MTVTTATHLSCQQQQLLLEAHSAIDCVPVSAQVNRDNFLVKSQYNFSTRAWIHLPGNPHGHGRWAAEGGCGADSSRKPLGGYCRIAADGTLHEMYANAEVVAWRLCNQLAFVWPGCWRRMLFNAEWRPCSHGPFQVSTVPEQTKSALNNAEMVFASVEDNAEDCPNSAELEAFDVAGLQQALEEDLHSILNSGLSEVVANVSVILVPIDVDCIKAEVA